MGRAVAVDRERPCAWLLQTVLDPLLADLPLAGTGLIVATSSGNIAGVFERRHAAGLPLGRDAGRAGPTLAMAARYGLGGPVTTLSVACASGTAALAVAEGWLADGICERVVVAGADALSRFVHAGFSGLGALSASLPTPFSDTHDGLLLGEGAAALLLEPDGALHVAGCGLASDAYHATAPDPDGVGAARAAAGALLRSGLPPDAITHLSPHGTGTPLNDAMERNALRSLFDRPRPLQLVKRAIGHTLGAAGAIEAAVAWRALHASGGGVLSLSSAFGGINAAAVIADRPGLVPAARPASVGPAVDRRGAPAPPTPAGGRRLDPYARAGLAALLAEHADAPISPQAALVLASWSNCACVDARYHARLLSEGAAAVSRRDFVATVPPSPLIAASLSLGVKGPMLAFVDGPARATDEAARLVRYGHADEAVALALEVDADGQVLAVTTTRIRHASA